jgi:hypothetical protein
VTYRATDNVLGREIVIKECFPADLCHRDGTAVGVTIALNRDVGYAAYAEWRMVEGEVLQWAFLTKLNCE